LARFATGVTVITALEDGQAHGMTANAFLSVSLDPPLVLVSLDNRSHMHRILQVAQRYGISVLAEDQQASLIPSTVEKKRFIVAGLEMVSGQVDSRPLYHEVCDRAGHQQHADAAHEANVYAFISMFGKVIA
jgi:flavin reductase (DIM6/NTAB) family NADH-FMN oxidoreductase RutF